MSGSAARRSDIPMTPSEENHVARIPRARRRSRVRPRPPDRLFVERPDPTPGRDVDARGRDEQRALRPGAAGGGRTRGARRARGGGPALRRRRAPRRSGQRGGTGPQRRRRDLPGRPVRDRRHRPRRHHRRVAGTLPRAATVDGDRPGGRQRPDAQGAGLRPPTHRHRAGRHADGPARRPGRRAGHCSARRRTEPQSRAGGRRRPARHGAGQRADRRLRPPLRNHRPAGRRGCRRHHGRHGRLRGDRHPQALPGPGAGAPQHRHEPGRRRRRHRPRRRAGRGLRHAGRLPRPPVRNDLVGHLQPDRRREPRGVLQRRRHRPAAGAARLRRRGHLRRPGQRPRGRRRAGR